MTRNRTVARVGVLVGIVGTLLLMASFGCKKEEEPPTMPGYYTGPIKPKGEAAPTPGRGGQAPKSDKGGSSMN